MHGKGGSSHLVLTCKGNLCWHAKEVHTNVKREVVLTGADVQREDEDTGSTGFADWCQQTGIYDLTLPLRKKIATALQNDFPFNDGQGYSGLWAAKFGIPMDLVLLRWRRIWNRMDSNFKPRTLERSRLQELTMGSNLAGVPNRTGLCHCMDLYGSSFNTSIRLRPMLTFLEIKNFLTKFSTFKVHSGGVREGISTEGVEIDEMTKRPNGICEGPWAKINLMPAAWPDSVKQLPSPPSPSVSATPYTQSTILLLLQQSGVLSSVTINGPGCVHFTFNLHDAEAAIPIVYGIGAQVSIYNGSDACLAVSHAHIDPVALGKTRPSATLTASSHSHRMSIEKFEGELSLEPAGVKGAIKQCYEFLKLRSLGPAGHTTSYLHKGSCHSGNDKDRSGLEEHFRIQKMVDLVFLGLPALEIFRPSAVRWALILGNGQDMPEIFSFACSDLLYPTMRFIIPGTCVLLGLSVVGGARPTGPGGTDSSAPSTNSGAASTKSSITAYTNTDAASAANSAESRYKVLSQKEIFDLTDIFTKTNTYEVVDGDIQALPMQDKRLLREERGRYASRRPHILEGKPWIAIELLTSDVKNSWSMPNQDLKPQPLYSATPYAKSIVLLLLQQSGILAQDIIKDAFVHFVSNYNDVRLADYYGYVRTGGKNDIPYPLGRLEGILHSPSFHAKDDYKGKVLQETRGEAGMGKCLAYLKIVFSEAEAHNKQLIVTPPSTQGPQLQVTTNHSAKRKRPSNEESPTQEQFPDSAISISSSGWDKEDRARADPRKIQRLQGKRPPDVRRLRGGGSKVNQYGNGDGLFLFSNQSAVLNIFICMSLIMKQSIQLEYSTIVQGIYKDVNIASYVDALVHNTFPARACVGEYCESRTSCLACLRPALVVLGFASAASVYENQRSDHQQQHDRDHDDDNNALVDLQVINQREMKFSVTYVNTPTNPAGEKRVVVSAFWYDVTRRMSDTEQQNQLNSQKLALSIVDDEGKKSAL
ncbi:hypothetical protein EV360DRAFT_69693 [Lentinula raphanica]|nr:hypothetical protein EV360DRAFT_69693 [Lentinula raphanica]